MLLGEIIIANLPQLHPDLYDLSANWISNQNSKGDLLVKWGIKSDYLYFDIWLDYTWQGRAHCCAYLINDISNDRTHTISVQCIAEDKSFSPLLSITIDCI